MNRRTFLKSAAASAVLAKLGLSPAKSLVLKTNGQTALTLDHNHSLLLGGLTTDGTGELIYVSTPDGAGSYYYKLWSTAEKRPLAS